MSSPDAARRALGKISFAGVDITEDMRKYLLTLSYTDNEEDESDDLQITLQDRDGVWETAWLKSMLDTSAAGGFAIHAAILRENWNGGGKDKVLDCGTFQLDSITSSGPPAVITIKAAALPFTSQIRQTKISRAWENYTLYGIAAEMAKKNGMGIMFLSGTNPAYTRVEQYRETNISFLSTLCHRAGLSLKVTDSMLVLFDPARYEATSPVLTIAKGGGAYTKYKLNIGKADAEYSDCCVSYVDPATGKKIYGTATADDYNAASKTNQTLNVYAKVGSVAEAQTLAAKLLRQRNQQEQTASFTMPGNPDLVAGVTVYLTGWGLYDGKWLVSQAKHELSGNGYTTTVALRKCLEG